MPKKKDDKKKKNILDNSVRMEIPVPDFVPYACHSDPHTILTKNGELLQIIKITGFSYETVGSQTLSLREVLRNAVIENVKNTNFALWFHTVRRRSDLDPGGDYPENFASFLNRAWCTKNNWSDQYVNEVYITLIYDGQSTKFLSPSGIFSSIYFPKRKKSHNEYLDKAAQLLNDLTDNMLVSLEHFGAKKLGIAKDDGTYYSEPIRFINKIMSLEDMPMPMPVTDISKYLVTHKVAFGNNAFEVTGNTGKHFGTIFSIKEYHELSDKLLDTLLQLPLRFLITQSVDFINSKTAKAEYEKQKIILDASGDEYLKKITGIDKIIENTSDSDTDFGEHQITIMLIADTLDQINQDVELLVFYLNRLGIVAVREDLFMEQCFWSQLPANFQFLSRQSYINTSITGGYASLNNFPAGKKIGNHWGPAVTVFRTVNDTPYFFNFHIENNGHTMIIGPYGTGKTVLLNFLLAEARKYNNNLYFFDQMRASKTFIKAIGGHYLVVKKDNLVERRLNPFILPIETHIVFLVQWVQYLLKEGEIDTFVGDVNVIQDTIEQLYRKYPEAKDRSLTELHDIFKSNHDSEYVERLNKWLGDGQYAGHFDGHDDYLEQMMPVIGFGMSYILEDKDLLLPILSYLLYRIEISLDGTPTIIVLDEAWKLIDNEYFSEVLEPWLDMLMSKNAFIIFATESVESATSSALTAKLIKSVATQIYLPNPKATESYIENFGLSNDEFKMLHDMKNEKREFLLKKKNEAIVAKLDLSSMEELYVLSGNDETVGVMEQVLKEKGDVPDIWLNEFYTRMHHIMMERQEKERLEKLKETQKEIQMTQDD